MALAHGTGAEVQKPLAMVVIGGLITATAVTLVVLPAIAQLVLQLGRGRTVPDASPAEPSPVTH
jgi:cobalt-zinc-cadmium resistance protein CzcA